MCNQKFIEIFYFVKVCTVSKGSAISAAVIPKATAALNNLAPSKWNFKLCSLANLLACSKNIIIS